MDFIFNKQITCETTRIVNHPSAPAGVIKTKDAMALAESLGVDLIQINENEGTAICVLQKSDKFLYERAKRKKQSVKTSETKEIRLALGIADNDMRHKAKNASKMIDGGARVILTIRLRGREINRVEEAKMVFEKFCALCGDVTYENQPKLSGNTVMASLRKK